MSDTINERPASFDARVMEYLPGLKRLAAKRVPPMYRDDLVTDTIAYAIEHWRNFREDGGMWNWLVWQMRGILKNEATKAAVRAANISFVPLDRSVPTDRSMRFSVPPNQVDYVELCETLGDLDTRDGGVVIRRAMGETLPVIAADLGVSAERVRQIEEKERSRLVKARAA
ncbi:hypothetical protein CO659_12865 [Rhizobium sp. S9]|uniref:sigma-70 family RNA polymerase sigma factor n=1 Tax=Rhizobium sp. S9 TaxID=2035454 RepID=UPI000BE98293|nr:sigma-70 family RNA polymerase sigma factor [Rhizobium sp. S9]PDS97546.1 hypothetical protein CO659_12865 [Rhizobium sp. S9]